MREKKTFTQKCQYPSRLGIEMVIRENKYLRMHPTCVKREIIFVNKCIPVIAILVKTCASFITSIHIIISLLLKTIMEHPPSQKRK